MHSYQTKLAKIIHPVKQVSLIHERRKYTIMMLFYKCINIIQKNITVLVGEEELILIKLNWYLE